MPVEDSWRMATAQDDGKPIIFRIRDNPPSFATKESFPLLLAVCWQYVSPNEQGMPASEDTERMSQLEDLLVSAFENAQEAFLTVVVTGNGVREWQWYARTQNGVMKLVNETLGKLEPFPVQFSFQDDPDWEGYAQFLEILGSK